MLFQKLQLLLRIFFPIKMFVQPDRFINLINLKLNTDAAWWIPLSSSTSSWGSASQNELPSSCKWVGRAENDFAKGSLTWCLTCFCNGHDQTPLVTPTACWTDCNKCISTGRHMFFFSPYIQPNSTYLYKFEQKKTQMLVLIFIIFSKKKRMVSNQKTNVNP